MNHLRNLPRGTKFLLALCCFMVLLCLAVAVARFYNFSGEDSVQKWVGILSSVFAAILWSLVILPLKASRFIAILVIANIIALKVNMDNNLRFRQRNQIYDQYSQVEDSLETDWHFRGDKLSKILRVGHYSDALILTVVLLDIGGLIFLWGILKEREELAASSGGDETDKTAI